jgi:hypothetical protein
MAVGVVDLLEVIQVYEKQPERPLVTTVLIEAFLDLHVAVAPVGNAGDGIEKRQGPQLFEFALGGIAREFLAEDFRRADDFARGVAERRRADGDGDSVTLLVVEIGEFGFVGLAGLQGIEGRTTA